MSLKKFLIAVAVVSGLVCFGACFVGAYAAMYDWHDPDPMPMVALFGSFGFVVCFLAGMAAVEYDD